MATFRGMTETQLRRYLHDFPEDVDLCDYNNHTPLFQAAHDGNLTRVTWLLKEKGPGIHARALQRSTALHVSASPDIVAVLLNHGADPTLRNGAGDVGATPLMHLAGLGLPESLGRLLTDQRALATLDWTMPATIYGFEAGYTALHLACAHDRGGPENKQRVIELLLAAGADPTIRAEDGETPLDVLRWKDPLANHGAIRLLEDAMAESERAAILVKARSIAVGKPYLQGRVGRGEPLPRLELVEDEELDDTLHQIVGFLTGAEGPGSQVVPEGVFRYVLGFVLAPWDPLRKGAAAEDAGTMELAQ